MEASGPIPIEDRAANKEKLSKKTKKNGKSQSKTGNEPEISKIEEDIANFVVQRDRLAEETAGAEQMVSIADQEIGHPSEPDDRDDRELTAGGSAGGASGQKRKSPDDGDDSSTSSEKGSDSSVSVTTARGGIFSNSDSSSDSDSDSESESSRGSEGKSSKATTGNPTGTPSLKIKKRNTSRSVAIFGGTKVQRLTTLDGDAVHAFKVQYDNLRSNNMKNAAITLIDSTLHSSIRQKMLSLGKTRMAADLEKVRSTELVEFLEKAFPAKSRRNMPQTVESCLRSVNFKQTFDPTDSQSGVTLVQAINEHHDKFPECHTDSKHQKELVTLLLELIGKSTPALKTLLHWMCHKGKPTTVLEFNVKLLKVTSKLADACNMVRDLGYPIPSKDSNHDSRKRERDQRSDDRSENKRNKNSSHGKKSDSRSGKKQDFPACKYCGRNNHKMADCSVHKRGLKHHNTKGQAEWKDSLIGKAWKLAGHNFFQQGETLDSKFIEDAKAGFKKKKSSKADSSDEGEEQVACCIECDSCCCVNHNIHSPNITNPFTSLDNDSSIDEENSTRDSDLLAQLQPFTSDDDYTIAASIITLKNNLPIRFLLDIGSLQSNYISVDLAKALEAAGVERKECNQKVCSALHGICKQTHGRMSFYVEYFNVYELRNERMKIDAKVLDISFDLIIGLPSIKSYKLVTDKFAYKFSSGVIPVGGNLAKPVVTTTAGTTHNANPNGVVAGLVEQLRKQRRVSKSEIIRSDPDDDGIEDDPSPEPWNETPLPSESSVIDLVHIEGEELERSRIREFLVKFQDVFSKKLRPEPALVPPMELNVDVDKWENSPQNHTPPRVQSAVRQDETRRQVEDMLDHHVIRPCTDPISSYSQVLLTPKSNGQYRFCIDFRNLNALTKSLIWPIPNIQAMIERLGNKRPQYFAIMDLTKGYYQAPLAESSRHFTAFITLMGLYEWTRVPMGLKGAPAYFQRVMATVVLAGLIYSICEVYLDDVIVYASSIDELITNLTKVFERFRKHNITLNPEKCRFGMRETEYVGRVINSEGWKFSNEKKAEVFNFRQPKRLGELKSFIGLCEYFHSHVRNFSDIMKPLQEALQGYSKKFRHTKLRFTTEQETAFKTVQEEIAKCATLYFLDPDAPVFLQTDASDYGIGAYLFQQVDGQQRPVAFLSKTLDRTQLRWSTPEKEGFAIYFALKKLNHLLRDIHFTLQTDHKNLIYINDTASPKVVRWKLAIQEYDFDIEHIAGKNNPVADGLSRFCQFPTREEEEQDLSIDMTEYVMGIIDEFEIPHDMYKVIARCHKSIVGHHGVQRTFTKVTEYLKTNRNKEPWAYMREHIRMFIKRCPCCQKMSRLKVPIHTHPFTTATYAPMHRIAVDTIGPLPPDDEGNQHIIVFIDCFSRYVCLYPTKDVTAKSAAKALLKFVGHYGVPPQFISDNGTQFRNELIKEFMELIGSEHVFTMAYSKEENALVERVNKEVMRHMRNIIFDQRVKKCWGDYYPLVERIINSQVHSTTKVSPAQIIYGNAIDLDRGILLPHLASRHEKMQLSEWTSRMLQAQEDIIRIAKEHQEEHDVHHISMHTSERTEFPINSYVLIQYENSEHRAPSKLHPHLKGPFQVVNYAGSVYTVRNLVTNKLEDYHITNLRPFEYDPLRVDPRKVANVDQDMVDIDIILQHTGEPKRKGNMKFLVKWSDGDQTWEYWNNVRRTEACHKYLEAHGMKHIIPREFFD